MTEQKFVLRNVLFFYSIHVIFFSGNCRTICFLKIIILYYSLQFALVPTAE